jgi:hypothetical protein
VNRQDYDRTVVRALTKDDRESKLPVWAQDRLNDMRRAVETLARVNEDLLGTRPVSKVVLDTYGVRPDVYLGDNAAIRFDLGGRRNVRVYLRDGELQVMAVGGDLVVHPGSANTVALDVADK